MERSPPASSAARSQSKGRPNRSAAERRAQHNRANVRMVARIIKLHNSMEHRGSAVPRVWTDVVSKVKQSPTATASHPQQSHDTTSSQPQQPQVRMKRYSFVHPPAYPANDLALAYEKIDFMSSKLEELQQVSTMSYYSIQHLSAQVSYLESAISVVTAPSAAELSGQHVLSELVDEATLKRIQTLKSSRPSDVRIRGKRSLESLGKSSSGSAALDPTLVTSAPHDGDSMVGAASSTMASQSDDDYWWSCKCCDYKIPHNAQYKSQKKWQHVQTHLRT
mmetsp:Transcript_45266/g.79694  ORF Transcript_45266/g.79694 Transcript_45266/m.79694 type:complete len:278 (-) Transcript_45266:270-1103(-)